MKKTRTPSYPLRLPTYRKRLNDKELSAKRNELLAPLKKIVRQLREYPSPKCFEIDPDLGYSADQLKSHVESGFNRYMSWSNTDDWFLDHIFPIHDFLKAKNYDLRKIHAFENLTPKIDTKKLRREKANLAESIKEYKRLSPKLTDAKQEARRSYIREYMLLYSNSDAQRAYHREYMRRRRAAQKETKANAVLNGISKTIEELYAQAMAAKTTFEQCLGDLANGT